MKQGALVKGIRFLAFILGSLLVVAQAAQSTTLIFDSELVRISPDGHDISYDTLSPVIVGSSTKLPALHSFLRLGANESAADFAVVSADSTPIGRSRDAHALDDLPTSIDAESFPPLIDRRPGAQLGSSPLQVVGEFALNGQRYAEMLVFPVTIDLQGVLWFHSSIQIATPKRKIEAMEFAAASPDRAIRTFSRSISVGQALEYVIVTDSTLAPAFGRLERYKNETGYRTGVVTIESILSSYPGVDDAEKLRNYLKDFYTSGGQYVLLGGDGTIVPIRYAYNLPADSLPSLPDMQICDLYYADLTGDWDKNHDGVFGEPYQDAADIVPELLVGRLPFRDTLQVSRYIDKLIKYETNPGNGDKSYLTRTFFFSSDQMRDWLPMSQHTRIAEAFPPAFRIDTANGVEFPRGDDPSPSNLSPKQLRPILSTGFGIINIIAHGRDDGFAVKTSGYNLNPKQYLLTSPQSGTSDCFDSVQAMDKPSFYYSLACNNGQFDDNQPPFNSGGLCFATNVLSEANGAVGFVGYSRWGWVGTSYLLHAAFFDSLFAHPDRPASAALYESKLAYSYYRDLVYGLNYFGDPTLRVYCSTPQDQQISTTFSPTGVDILVSASGVPAAGSLVTLSSDGKLLARALTSADGRAHFDLPVNYTTCVVTASRPGSTVARASFSSPIVTGIDDHPNSVPRSFSLSQNYPNPFNPSTHIKFSLPERSVARLDIFDLLGREIKGLGETVYSAGEHELVWDGTDELGRGAASGVYFYRLTAGSYQQSRKMVLLK